MAPSRLFIGKLAAETGFTPKTIRYYEAVGVLPAPARTESRYRVYPREAAEVLKFIRKAKTLGLTLSEIREIVGIRTQGRLPCIHVRQLINAKIAETDKKLAELTGLKVELKRLLRSWDLRVRAGGEGAVVCPHIEAAPLAVPAPPSGRARHRRTGRRDRRRGKG